MCASWNLSLTKWVPPMTNITVHLFCNTLLVLSCRAPPQPLNLLRKTNGVATHMPFLRICAETNYSLCSISPFRHSHRCRFWSWSCSQSLCSVCSCRSNACFPLPLCLLSYFFIRIMKSVGMHPGHVHKKLSLFSYSSFPICSVNEFGAWCLLTVILVLRFYSSLPVSQFLWGG